MRRRIVQRVVFLVTLLLLLPARVAFAQYPGGGETPPVVRGEKFFRGGTARTGWDALTFLIVALILVVLGLLVWYASKRGAQSDA